MYPFDYLQQTVVVPCIHGYMQCYVFFRNNSLSVNIFHFVHLLLRIYFTNYMFTNYLFGSIRNFDEIRIYSKLSVMNSAYQLFDFFLMCLVLAWIVSFKMSLMT